MFTIFFFMYLQNLASHLRLLSMPSKFSDDRLKTPSVLDDKFTNLILS
jgi:hypothetical protein